MILFDNNLILDDGGEPIQYYEIEKQDQKDGNWVPCGRSTDPHFVVEGLQKNNHYKFRVKAVNSEGKSDPLDTEESIQAKNPYERPDKPGAPVPMDWDADHVDLKWDPPLNGKLRDCLKRFFRWRGTD